MVLIGLMSYVMAVKYVLPVGGNPFYPLMGIGAVCLLFGTPASVNLAVTTSIHVSIITLALMVFPPKETK
jgi:hypothetical protein